MRNFLAPAALIVSVSSSALAQESAPEPTQPAEPSPAASAPEVVVPEGDSIEATPPDAAVQAPAGEPFAPTPAREAPAYPAPPPIRAEVPPSEPESDTDSEGAEPDDGLLGSHQAHVTLQLGVRTTFVSDPGFDLFSENDAYTQFGLSGGRVLIAEGPLSVAALAGWDYGNLGSNARGVKTALIQHRLWLGGEIRYHIVRRAYAFVRLAPALVNTQASLVDPTAQTSRNAGGWVFGADGSAGAAFEVFGKRTGHSALPRGWFTIDGGYTWAEREDLTFSVSEDDSAPTRTASLDLGDLALRGGFFRVGVAVTF